MNIGALKESAVKVAIDNASTILTAGGAVGTVVTAVLTGRASFQAAETIQQERERMQDDRTLNRFEPDRSEKMLLTWRYFVPPVFVGGATLTSIIWANRVSAQRAAALAAAYGLAEGRLQDYKDKVEEKLTGPKNQQLKAELAQDKVNANPPDASKVIIVGGGDVLCLDEFSGRYFRSSAEMIKRAEAFINSELRSSDYCSLSQFYDELGIPATTMSDMVGWNSTADTSNIEVQLSTVMSPDQKPCLALDFVPAPRSDYNKVY